MKKPSSKRPNSSGDLPKSLPEPNSEEFAFLVATHAWRDGLTANAIVRKLGLSSEPIHLMQVKRALARAHGKYLLLMPPEELQWRDRLDTKINPRRRRPVNFHVVADSRAPVFAAVPARAAVLLSEIINAARTETVYCNAGGRTVASMVRALTRIPIPLDQDGSPPAYHSKLTFVAGNAASHPDRFNLSSNFLSVTMAEAFEAKHLALPMSLDDGFRQKYKQLVDDAALFVFAVGDPNSSVLAMNFQARGWEVPKKAVGDLAFNLVDSEGEPVVLPREPQAFLSQVNPEFSLTRLLKIAANHRSVLILDCDDPETKVGVGIAALRRGYATDLVLGTRMAQLIHARY